MVVGCMLMYAQPAAGTSCSILIKVPPVPIIDSFAAPAATADQKRNIPEETL